MSKHYPVLHDPRNPAFWLDGEERSEDTVFNWNTGEPSIFRTLNTSEKQSNASTQRVARERSDGQDWSSLRTEQILKPVGYSLPIEGREAGQRAADRRDALRRGSI